MPISQAQADALWKRIEQFEEAVRNHELIGAQNAETADEFEADYTAQKRNLTNYINRLAAKPKKAKTK